MSATHEVMLKPICEVAEYKRNLIPTNIPKNYVLKSLFDDIASEESIRSGVIAFRDFLYLFFPVWLQMDIYTPYRPKSQVAWLTIPF